MSEARRQLSLPYGIISRMAGNRSSGASGRGRGRQMLADSSTPSRAGIRTSQSTATSWRGSLAGSRVGVGHAGESRAADATRRRRRPCHATMPRWTAASLETRRRVAYENPWITVWHDEVTRPDGNPGIYGVVHFANRGRRRRGDRRRRPESSSSASTAIPWTRVVGDPGGWRAARRGPDRGRPARAPRGDRPDRHRPGASSAGSSSPTR